MARLAELRARHRRRPLRPAAPPRVGQAPPQPSPPPSSRAARSPAARSREAPARPEPARARVPEPARAAARAPEPARARAAVRAPVPARAPELPLAATVRIWEAASRRTRREGETQSWPTEPDLRREASK